MIITLHSEVYPIETVLQTCYQFIEEVYFYIDLDEPGKRIKVQVSFKTEKLSPIQAKKFRNKFLEELLHASLRHSINQRNQKLREYIVGSALFSRDPLQAAVSFPEDVSLEKEVPKGPLNDPLGIAVPWEQHHGK